MIGSELPDYLIVRGGPIICPARSPDLTSVEFFSWGYVKDKLYISRRTSLTQLKQIIKSSIRNIPKDMVQNVLQNMQSRFSAVFRENEEHIENSM